jgi:hypothetical protein
MINDITTVVMFITVIAKPILAVPSAVTKATFQRCVPYLKKGIIVVDVSKGVEDVLFEKNDKLPRRAMRRETASMAVKAPRANSEATAGPESMTRSCRLSGKVIHSAGTPSQSTGVRWTSGATWK